MKSFGSVKEKAHEAYCTRSLLAWFGMAAIVALFGVFLLPSFVAGLVDPTREIAMNLFPSLLVKPFITVRTFYVCSVFAYVAVSCFILWCFTPVVRVRNRAYLLESLYSNNERAPVAGFDDMVKRTMGSTASEENEESREERLNVERMLLENIEPIEAYIKSMDSGQNVLVVEGAWGVGKTSNVLVAIDRLGDDGSSGIRYIYESAFKYNANIGEFKRDVLKALYDVLAEMKIYAHKPIEDVVDNITVSPAETLIGVLKSFMSTSSMPLTTDLVSMINDKYRRARDKRKLKIVIILDDLDRLQGEDILSTLAFLSVVRRLEFVKIILPLSLKTVGTALGGTNIPEPRQIIRKYLPEQNVVIIKSGVDVVERIALQKIKGTQKDSRSEGIYYCAAWAAVLMKLISDWLVRAADQIDWDGLYVHEGNGRLGGYKLPDKVNMDVGLRRVIERSIVDVNDALKRVNGGLRYTLGWPSGTSDLRRFENLVLKVQLRLRFSGEVQLVPATEYFDEDMYHDIVASWIFKFVEGNWEYLDINLRGVMDILNKYDFSGLSSNGAEQFAQVFNQLFPNTPIMPNDSIANNGGAA